jgi:hypothetical protein
MQQLPHPAFMQHQQWPIPPLWYNNGVAWPIDYNTMATQWQPQTNMWNTQQPQPMAPRPMPLPYAHASATARGNHLRTPDKVVLPSPSQPRPVERATVTATTPSTRVASAVLASDRDASTLDPRPLPKSRSIDQITMASAGASESAAEWSIPRSATAHTTATSDAVGPSSQPPTLRLQLQPPQSQCVEPPAKPIAKRKSAPNPSESELQAAESDVLAEPADLSSKRITATTTTRTSAIVSARRGQGNTCVTRGEQSALLALQELFPGKEFVKVRPQWLLNDTGRPMEIDLFCAELRLGVEHSGLSHYVFPSSLHKTRDEFDATVRRDFLKRKLCARANVLLIEIPFTVKHAAMRDFILSEIERLSDEHGSR